MINGTVEPTGRSSRMCSVQLPRSPDVGQLTQRDNRTIRAGWWADRNVRIYPLGSSSEDFQFSSAHPPFWRVRARSSSWGTPQKGHEDQAAGPAGGDPGHAPPTPRRNHHHAVFRHFGGHREFNPLVVLFRPFRLAKVFRFWLAFKDWKHGYREPVERLRQDLLVAL